MNFLHDFHPVAELLMWQGVATAIPTVGQKNYLVFLISALPAQQALTRLHETTTRPAERVPTADFARFASDSVTLLPKPPLGPLALSPLGCRTPPAAPGSPAPAPARLRRRPRPAPPAIPKSCAAPLPGCP